MGLAQGYSAKAPIISRYTIQATNTWEQAFSAVAGVRKWLIKLDNADTGPIRIHLGVEANYITDSGNGFSFDGCDLPDVYVYGTQDEVVELLYWG